MVDSGEVQAPVFSIGVTTYNRKELLKQTIISILNQTFTSFEVIVGNDYLEEPLTGNQLGINDPRIRFVNHTENFKEIGNMNELLRLANGKYFTWLADDDLYHPRFLTIIYEVLKTYNFPPAVFSSFDFIRGIDFPIFSTTDKLQKQILNNRQFINMGLKLKPKIMATNGVFDINALRRIGGVENLCDSGVGLYAEYIFLVKSALLETIAYVDAPLVLYRMHPGSWSGSNIELKKYNEAGPELIRRSAEVLRHPSLSNGFNESLTEICTLHLATYAGKTATYEIVENTNGLAAVCRAISRFLKEVEKSRIAFVSEGGSAGYYSKWVFSRTLLRGFYIIVGMLTMNRLRKLWSNTKTCAK